jgi:hypothetical protein
MKDETSQQCTITHRQNCFLHVIVQSGVWKGEWGCTLCPDDDDPEVSGPTLTAWENEFVAELLESSHKVFQTIRSCAIDLESGEDTSPSIPNADIDLWCGKHINLATLSVAKGTFLAHALQISYNKAHANSADDDSLLSDVYYHKSLSKEKKSSNVLAGDIKQDIDGVGSTSMIKKRRPAPWFNPKYNNKWSYGGYNSGVTSPGLSGDWSCRLCAGDDDLLFEGQDGATKSAAVASLRHEKLLQGAASGPTLKVWEAELNVLLQEGPFESFRKIDWCEIKLMPHKILMKEIEAAVNEPEAKDGCGIRGSCADGMVKEE